MFFDDSRPDRQKRAQSRARGRVELEGSPIPPARQWVEMTDAELFCGTSWEFVYDVECYPNYFCVSLLEITTDKVVVFENSPDKKIDINKLGFILHRFKIIGFNSKPYDLPLTLLAAQGLEPWKLKEISNEIINEGMRPFEVERKYGIKSFTINHIDLIEVAPLDGSLKIYGARLHSQRLQELPYRHDTYLTQEQAVVVLGYNVNDLDVTKLLYLELLPYIELRERIGAEIGTDLRSKSDAQISEAVIKAELSKLGVTVKKPEINPGHRFRYKVPPSLKYNTPQLQSVLATIANTDFVIDEDGTVDLPKSITELKINIGNCRYQMGIGGLHSTEESIAHVADEKTLLIDRDVASYYPAIILLQRLFPTHLGEAFLKVMQILTTRRLQAKAKAKQCKDAGDKEGEKYWKREADSLKITINGAFGKLGNVYSLIYSPELLIQVTLSGQLFLLMFIEMLELAKFEVVSANTDGVVAKVDALRYGEYETLCVMWEELTGFETEETRYKALYSRDVNNYIAVKMDGTCKTKGTYSEVGSALNSVLSKNPENLICSDAVQAFLSKGVPIKDTIYDCKDIRRFVSVRNVRGGAYKDGCYLGKVVRYYYAHGEEGCIRSVVTNDKVSNSEGGKPLMDMPNGFPNDINHDAYINKAEAMLYDVGYYVKPKLGRLF